MLLRYSVFNSTSQYLDYLLNTEYSVSQINLIELQLNKANSYDIDDHFRTWTYVMVCFHLKCMLKRDDHNFEIVNFPFLGGDVSRSPYRCIFISQLIHFPRVCSNVSDFNNGNQFLNAKLLKQGY